MTRTRTLSMIKSYANTSAGRQQIANARKQAKAKGESFHLNIVNTSSNSNSNKSNTRNVGHNNNHSSRSNSNNYTNINNQKTNNNNTNNKTHIKTNNLYINDNFAKTKLGEVMINNQKQKAIANGTKLIINYTGLNKKVLRTNTLYTPNNTSNTNNSFSGINNNSNPFNNNTNKNKTITNPTNTKLNNNDPFVNLNNSNKKKTNNNNIKPNNNINAAQTLMNLQLGLTKPMTNKDINNYIKDELGKTIFKKNNYYMSTDILKDNNKVKDLKKEIENNKQDINNIIKEKTNKRKKLLNKINNLEKETKENIKKYGHHSKFTIEIYKKYISEINKYNELNKDNTNIKQKINTINKTINKYNQKNEEIKNKYNYKNKLTNKINDLNKQLNQSNDTVYNEKINKIKNKSNLNTINTSKNLNKIYSSKDFLKTTNFYQPKTPSERYKGWENSMLTKSYNLQDKAQKENNTKTIPRALKSIGLGIASVIPETLSFLTKPANKVQLESYKYLHPKTKFKPNVYETKTKQPALTHSQNKQILTNLEKNIGYMGIGETLPIGETINSALSKFNPDYLPIKKSPFGVETIKDVPFKSGKLTDLELVKSGNGTKSFRDINPKKIVSELGDNVDMAKRQTPKLPKIKNYKLKKIINTLKNSDEVVSGSYAQSTLLKPEYARDIKDIDILSKDKQATLEKLKSALGEKNIIIKKQPTATTIVDKKTGKDLADIVEYKVGEGGFAKKFNPTKVNGINVVDAKARLGGKSIALSKNIHLEKTIPDIQQLTGNKVSLTGQQTKGAFGWSFIDQAKNTGTKQTLTSAQQDLLKNDIFGNLSKEPITLGEGRNANDIRSSSFYASPSDFLTKKPQVRASRLGVLSENEASLDDFLSGNAQLRKKPQIILFEDAKVSQVPENMKYEYNDALKKNQFTPEFYNKYKSFLKKKTATFKPFGNPTSEMEVLAPKGEVLQPKSKLGFTIINNKKVGIYEGALKPNESIKLNESIKPNRSINELFSDSSNFKSNSSFKNIKNDLPNSINNNESQLYYSPEKDIFRKYKDAKLINSIKSSMNLKSKDPNYNLTNTPLSYKTSFLDLYPKQPKFEYSNLFINKNNSQANNTNLKDPLKQTTTPTNIIDYDSIIQKTKPYTPKLIYPKYKYKSTHNSPHQTYTKPKLYNESEPYIEPKTYTNYKPYNYKDVYNYKKPITPFGTRFKRKKKHTNMAKEIIIGYPTIKKNGQKTTKYELIKKPMANTNEALKLGMKLVDNTPAIKFKIKNVKSNGKVYKSNLQDYVFKNKIHKFNKINKKGFITEKRHYQYDKPLERRSIKHKKSSAMFKAMLGQL